MAGTCAATRDCNWRWRFSPELEVYSFFAWGPLHLIGLFGYSRRERKAASGVVEDPSIGWDQTEVNVWLECVNNKGSGKLPFWPQLSATRRRESLMFSLDVIPEIRARKIALVVFTFEEECGDVFPSGSDVGEAGSSWLRPLVRHALCLEEPCVDPAAAASAFRRAPGLGLDSRGLIAPC
ncbi:hypothetical protein NDU88_003416 [Pleurodeles waltl]|uniref:Uncharacterized protein n=1 Tax=Pleurodeles waltl TaxID=8319 RepID=A0AAV7WP26_PLEWA|nr:hypothetical protein NDU88_003416 [Pleurodeles waltl]